MTKFEKLQINTKNTALLWQDVQGIASVEAAGKLKNAMLDWTVELTDCLHIWLEKGTSMSDGELILARVNLGTLVESWLKFFYCVHYDDYLKNPQKNKNTIIEPNDMTLENLKKFSIGPLFDSKLDNTYIWINKIQKQRNAIHAFNLKDIGTPQEFIDDVSLLSDFVDKILLQLPDIEGTLEYLPGGYEIILPF
ncbi:hypothetical protein [Fusobacterium ulcerans]|uniref:hypothetical protein n=1 Tax=Fusobacterium ulcerans TaxID=861 RepID=UPI001D09DBBD|nr:hypothetical protein [Fusobacterium ulcerans]MCB8566292.1 hypothetical protein [Fusobacterium ulcerans]MCB8650405.1 hypothetical protein [Fusobacterium ulcerans]